MAGIKPKGRRFLLRIACFSPIVLFSCSDDSEKNKIVLEALNESIINSSLLIERSTQSTYLTLENKLSDPGAHIKAERWYPKAKQAREITTQIILYIEDLKNILEKEKNLNNSMTIELFKAIMKYKKDIMDIDSSIAVAFDTTLILTTRTFDSYQHTGKEFSKTFFDGTSSETKVVILNKFQNNIKIVENRLVSFFKNRFTDHSIFEEWFWPVVAQNSSVLQAGEELEITAGVGSFTRAAQPEVKINGLNVPVDATGVTIFKFPASTKPGKHFVPVEISYTDQDGKKQTITKTVEYTVASIPFKK